MLLLILAAITLGIFNVKAAPHLAILLHPQGLTRFTPANPALCANTFPIDASVPKTTTFVPTATATGFCTHPRHATIMFATGEFRINLIFKGTLVLGGETRFFAQTAATLPLIADRAVRTLFIAAIAAIYGVAKPLTFIVAKIVFGLLRR